MPTRVGGEALLSLMQLSDSAFPSGTYTTSSGLEALFTKGKVVGAEDFQRLALAYLRMQVGTADCVALGNAYRAASASDLRAVKEIDERLFSMKLPAAVREASVRTGGQLLASASAFAAGGLLAKYRRAVESGMARGTAPVALAVVCSALRVGLDESASVLLYSSLMSLVGAGLRLGIIDHRDGQRILHSSKRTMVELSKNSRKGPQSMRQFFPALEIAQMEHERTEGRMFVT